MENIIECNNLTHYYGKRLIYENLSFTVPKGRILGTVRKKWYRKNHYHQYIEWLSQTTFRPMCHLRSGYSDYGPPLSAGT